MQFKTIFRILGTLLMIYSLSMLPPIAVAELYRDSAITPYIISFLITCFAGAFLWFPFRNAGKDLKVRDGFLITILFWVILSFFGALPFMLAKVPHLSFTDAIFESVSGLTTTGSSVISGLGLLPHAIMYYRQQIQFLGGMGIIVLAVAILPMLGIGGMQLYRAEVPGPTKDAKLVPRIAETAKTLWLIYIALTAACVLFFWMAGMDLFNAVGESFATISTGGFAMHDTSFAYYHSPLIEMICVVFMILGGTNFSLHFLALQRKRLYVYWQDAEFRIYILVLLSVIIVTAGTLLYYGHYGNPNTAITKAIFDVTSLLTTCGFVAGNFSHWPTFIPFLIMAGTLVGACGGSTSGGVKLIRAIIAFKQTLVEIKRLIHPRSIITLKLGDHIVPAQLLQSIWGFITLYLLSTLFFILLLLAQGVDITTSIGAVVSSIANAGAGIGAVSANFGMLSTASKWTLTVAMIAGRFEIFTILVLFTPSFWRK